jgi:hypothetical protein
MSIDAPPAGSTALNVRVGGDRIGDSYSNVNATGVAGVRMRLSSSATNPNAWSNSYGWTDCVSDADGDCTFIVPNRGSSSTNSSGMNRDAYPYVHIIEAPSGYFLNPQIRVGDGTGNLRNYGIDYVGRFGFQVVANQTYQAGKDFFAWRSWERPFMRDDDVDHGSGISMISRNNPPLPMKCGLNVAILVDVSSSIDDAGGMPAIRSALNTMIDSLVGTPSAVSLYSYGLLSPGTNAQPDVPSLQPVRTQAQATVLKNRYASWARSGTTNWDSAFMRAARSGNNYDLVVNLTDGMPTVHGTSPGGNDSDGWGNLIALESAVFSSNLVKATGAHVMTIAVGNGVQVTETHLNLRAISGDGNYYVTGDYASAAQYFSQYAKGLCEGSLEIQKRVIPADVDTTGLTVSQLMDQSAPAADWQFTVEASTSVESPTEATSFVTDDNGRVTLPLKFERPATSGQLTVTETLTGDYEIVPVNGRNAVCTNTNTGQAVNVANYGSDPLHPGFTTDVLEGTAIECVVFNTPPKSTTGRIQVEKRVIHDGAQIPANPTASDLETISSPAANWTINVQAITSPGIEPGTGPFLTDQEGLANIPVQFDNPSVTGVIEVTEVQQPGHSVIPVGGKNLVCESTSGAENTTSPVDVTSIAGDNPGGSFTIENAASVICVIFNQLRGGVTWQKVDPQGNLLGGSIWKIVGPLPATTEFEVTDCVADSAPECTGRDKNPAQGTFLVTDLPSGEYELIETSAPAGFRLDDTPHPFKITAGQTHIDLEEIVNHRRAALVIPLTGGLGSFHFLLVGGGFAALLLTGVVYRHFRSRRLLLVQPDASDGPSA